MNCFCNCFFQLHAGWLASNTKSATHQRCIGVGPSVGQGKIIDHRRLISISIVLLLWLFCLSLTQLSSFAHISWILPTCQEIMYIRGCQRYQIHS
jgi:hypothetical protein